LRALIFTHLLNALLFLLPTPYFRLNFWCLARVKPRSLAQEDLAFCLSARDGAAAALAPAGSVKATATAATRATKAVRIETCRVVGAWPSRADDVRICSMEGPPFRRRTPRGRYTS
jgi:hypothetical protein